MNKSFFKTELFEQILLKIDDGIIVLNNKDEIVYFNDSSEEILKLDKLNKNENFTNLIENHSLEKYEKFIKSLSREVSNKWELNIKVNDYIANIQISGYMYKDHKILMISKDNQDYIKLQQNIIEINNEMINLHRELEKRKQKLEQLNAIKEKLNKDLKTKNDYIKRDLNMARSVQLAILSNIVSNHNQMDIYKKSHPAVKVGGDLYDIVQISEGKVGIFIADVSGHGVASALVMVYLKDLFKRFYKEYSSPKKLLHRLNSECVSFFDRDKEIQLYVTGFYIILDFNKKLLTYSSAGHPYPFIFKESNQIHRLDLSGFPLGVLENSYYEENQIEISNNDRLFLFTDGLEEYVSELNQECQIENFNWGNIISHFHILADHLEEGTVPQDDDVSLMVIELKDI